MNTCTEAYNAVAVLTGLVVLVSITGLLGCWWGYTKGYNRRTQELAQNNLRVRRVRQRHFA